MGRYTAVNVTKLDSSNNRLIPQMKTVFSISACGGSGGSDSAINNDISRVARVTIVGILICDDFGGVAAFECRIVPPGPPPDTGSTITDTTESIQHQSNYMDDRLIILSSQPAF
jgi:hypothetical protein